MSVETEQELEALRAVGRLVAEALRAVRKRAQPGATTFREGDLVKLDVTAELDGFYTDACISVPVGRPSARTAALVRTARLALVDAMRVARSGGLSHPLTKGLVLTIEPIIATGDAGLRESSDGWTVCTADGSVSAHVEHTIVVTAGEPIVLTR